MEYRPSVSCSLNMSSICLQVRNFICRFLFRLIFWQHPSTGQIHIFRVRHLVRHPGLPSTSKDAHVFVTKLYSAVEGYHLFQNKKVALFQNKKVFLFQKNRVSLFQKEKVYLFQNKKDSLLQNKKKTFSFQYTKLFLFHNNIVFLFQKKNIFFFF